MTETASRLLGPTSSRVKAARRLSRRAARMDAREFLAEGPQAVREALDVPECVREVFVTEQAVARHGELLARAAQAGLVVAHCDERAMAALSGSVTPQGIVARCRFIDTQLTDALRPPGRLVVVMAHLRDPGNAGTVLRCADAAGADAVLFAGTSVDPYNDKTVRASVGSLFHVPIVVGVSVAEAVRALRESGFRVFAADGSARRTLDDLLESGALRRPVAWIFGNEAWGIPVPEEHLADEPVAIPLYGKAESLNVATAAAVCLYATAREQRRLGTDRPT